MWYRLVKWIAWAMTMGVLFYVGTALLLFYHVCTTSVYSTPWGKVDIDTAKIGFVEYWSHEPCYEVNMEVIDGDTVRYYFFKSREMYYKASRDSSGNVKIVNYYPYRKDKDGEVCTDYFRKEDIFIR